MLQLVQRIFRGLQTAPPDPLPDESIHEEHRCARTLGYFAGRFGGPCECPADIPRTEHHLFVEGWKAGRAMRAEHKRLDAD